MIALLTLLSCRGGISTETQIPHTHVSLVDDFEPRGPNGEDLLRSRFDTARSYFGNVNTDGERPILNTGDPPGALRYTMPLPAGLVDEGQRLDRLLGAPLNYDVQPELVGVKVQLDGLGDLRARLDGPDGESFWSEAQRIRTGTTELLFEVETDPQNLVTTLGLHLESGFAEIRRVELLLQERRPFADRFEEAFTFSFGQLSRCYDDEVHLVRVRCSVEDEFAVYGTDVSGLYALAAAVGADLGLVDDAEARRIVTDVRDALLVLDRDPVANLLPATTDGATVAPDGEWSSLATVVAAESAMLAGHAFQLRIDDLQGILQDIAWDELTDNGGKSVLAGYTDAGAPLGYRFGVFGAKSVVLQVAHGGALDQLYVMDLPFAPTWDGSGWDNELAALMFPMTGEDWIGNDWATHRSGQHWQHHTWSRESYAGDELSLFGLSTSEVPEPWTLEFGDPVGAWGVGGHNKTGDDGAGLAGYSVYAPHYPALVSAEFPDTTGAMFETLLNRRLLTPFNAVESIGIDDGDEIRVNHRLKAFSLAMQTLGLARNLSGKGYLPYRLVDTIPFLRDGHALVIPEAIE